MAATTMIKLLVHNMEEVSGNMEDPITVEIKEGKVDTLKTLMIGMDHMVEITTIDRLKDMEEDIIMVIIAVTTFMVIIKEAMVLTILTTQ